MILVKYDGQNRIRALAAVTSDDPPLPFWDEVLPDNAGVAVGWTKLPDGSFQPPVAPRMVTRRGFTRLFTQAERIAFRTAAASNPIFADLYELMTMDETINLDHPDVAAGIGAMVTAGLLTAPRAAAILAGTPPE